ncbi:hypothetical protein TNCV_3983541 [Trichonephila clavipes]|nr:hypothetical protein TNCV_3983541 [Trichonephila clavipes]
MKPIGISGSALNKITQLCDADLSSLDAGGKYGWTEPPSCTFACDPRRFGLMAVMNSAAISRTIAQLIQSVTHRLVSSRTIRRRFQDSRMSTRRPLLLLPLPLKHRRLCLQWCNERWT